MDNNAARSNRAMNPNTPATTAKATLSSSALAGVSFSAQRYKQQETDEDYRCTGTVFNWYKNGNK